MRKLLLVLSVFHGFNGLFMLFTPQRWYTTIPGVIETGPANVHFIRDIGLGFLVGALALLFASRAVHPRAFVILALIFLGGHALLHAAEYFHKVPSAATLGRDLITIFIPSLLPAIALVIPEGDRT